MDTIDPTPGWAPPAQAAYLVADVDRERVASLLREHWVAGRLSVEEFEQRLSGAMTARDQAELSGTLAGLPAPAFPPPAGRPAPAQAQSPNAIASLVLGVVGLFLLLMSFGLLSFVTLPLSAVGWGLGRSARRDADRRGVPRPGPAVPGEVLCIIGTVLSAVVVAGCAAIVV
jgi:hypothetical protein